MHTLRLAGKCALPLILWFSADELVRYVLLYAGTEVAYGDFRQLRLVAVMTILTLVVLAAMTVTTGMLHSMRGALWEVRARAADGVEDERFFRTLDRMAPRVRGPLPRLGLPHRGRARLPADGPAAPLLRHDRGPVVRRGDPRRHEPRRPRLAGVTRRDGGHVPAEDALRQAGGEGQGPVLRVRRRLLRVRLRLLRAERDGRLRRRPRRVDGQPRGRQPAPGRRWPTPRRRSRPGRPSPRRSVPSGRCSWTRWRSRWPGSPWPCSSSAPSPTRRAPWSGAPAWRRAWTGWKAATRSPRSRSSTSPAVSPTAGCRWPTPCG
ncbi:hypothetical protein ACFSTC_52625 [Nonomuraea ferruginea]